MFLKKSKVHRQLFFLVMVSCLMCPLELLAVDSNVRIEMEQATRKEVSVAVTQFVLGKGIGDPKGLGMEARKILENDLRLTEMFVQLEPKVYENLEQKEKEQLIYGPGIRWELSGLSKQNIVLSREESCH